MSTFKAEFDNHSDETQCRIELRTNEKFIDSIVIITEDIETTLIEACRDQWGVFYYMKDLTICQEDDTRSFIDALIKNLEKLKNRNEFTTESTVTETPDEE